ncbi:MAG: hypothetical protein ACTHJW_18655, partial [Streptosporangiaceae bacterium]
QPANGGSLTCWTVAFQTGTQDEIPAHRTRHDVFAPPETAGPPDLRTVAQGAGNTMEHDTGSACDPAASSGPEQLSSPPKEAAEKDKPADSHEPAEADETADEHAAAESQESGSTLTTGEPRVDAALGRLSDLDDLPVSEHPGVYERIHEQLVDVLGELHQGTQNR